MNELVDPIPSWWLNGHPQRIIIHWTAGTYKATSDDRQHYHIIIEGDGALVKGVHTIAANDSTGDGVYAAHTRGANTKAIGIALAGMAGSKEHPFDPGDYPITPIQWKTLIAALVQFCARYQITPLKSTVLSHGEVEKTLSIPQRGKWDVSVSPLNGEYLAPAKVGNLLREKVEGLLAVRRAQVSA